MAKYLRCVPVLLWVLLALATSGQNVTFQEKEISLRKIDVRYLREESTEVAGQGLAVPGIDLADKGEPRHAFGDDSTYALRTLVDTTWLELEDAEDSIVAGERIHWVRYHVYADGELKDVPLLLNVQARSPFTIYINGRELLRSTTLPPIRSGAVLPLSDSIAWLTTALSFLADGQPEVLALRIVGDPGIPLKAQGLRVTLHIADTGYTLQRTTMHYGVFIGINLIILLFALVIGWSERGERSWLLLAALSFVSVLDTLCELGEEMGALGLTQIAKQALGILDTILTPWPMYLLIMVLGLLRGDLSPKRARLYTIGVLIVTGICTLAAIAQLYGFSDFEDGVQFTDPAAWLIIPGILLAILFGLIVAWFAIEVVRLGIRLLRSAGYERWIGAGALASSLLTIVLGMVSEFSGSSLSGSFSVLSDYCSYVAVPVSVAVYLAIRSVHHNKLVTRQRDELDEEVKERTAELRAAKDRSDELLLNILPHDVAEELKETGAAAAKHFDRATVLFTDFRGFTQLSEQVGPAELVQELNACFKAFDGLMEKYSIEKIKTIGDAYMAAGGLPDPKHGSPVNVVRAALEMQVFMVQHRAEREAAGKPFFEMRLGIHTGPLIAGIVGVKKFQYDIWGDTVNTASRMESSGEVGQVNISESIYELVKDEPGLAFTARGKVQAKGKGEMEMYFVQAV